MLTFEIFGGDVKFDSLKGLMMQHVSRLRVLITEPQLQKLFDNLPAGSATHLQCIRLPPDAQSGAISATIERCLGSASSLKELDVPCSLDWNSKILTGLTHLILSGETLHPDGMSGAQDKFLSALRRMPFLHLLHLGEGRLPLPETSSASNPVNLPHLQSLRLSDSVARLCNALRSITFPRTVQPHLNFEITQLVEVKEIFPLLGAFKSSDRPLIRRLKVRWEERSMQLTGWPSSSRSQEVENDEEDKDLRFEEGDEEEDEEECHFQVRVLWPNQIRPREEHQQVVLLAISYIASPAPPLTVLSLSASELILDLSNYFMFLGHQPELHTIFVEGPIFWPLLQSIALTKTNPPNYPSLRHLNITSVMFNPKNQRPPFQVLQGILEVRKNYGMKLRSIDFSECLFLSRKHITALINKRTVDKVTWDEMEIGLSDLDSDDEENHYRGLE